jgi:hypothetical protein
LKIIKLEDDEADDFFTLIEVCCGDSDWDGENAAFEKVYNKVCKQLEDQNVKH